LVGERNILLGFALCTTSKSEARENEIIGRYSKKIIFDVNASRVLTPSIFWGDVLMEK
jgi:hypothetical protein